jgi:cobalamin biosynthesis Mg chelatase CobN
MNTGVQSSLENSTVVYTNGAPVNPAGVNVSTAANTTGRLINDMGPSFYSDTVAGSANTASLGEVAAQFKAAKAGMNARTLTNDDVQKMVGSKTGVTMAKNMPPLGPGAAPQSASQPGSGQTGTAAQATAQGVQSSTAQTAQSGTADQRAGTPPPASAQTGQGQAAGAEAAAGNSTTPQINQNQQSNDAQGKSKLPATATFLPLLGLLGVVSGGIGLWFRKWRR